MTASRKLAAILAADVVGYSRMMGEDEAGTAQAVRERREAAAPIVAAHSGRVFKTMGDATFIEFPSVVSAAECALEIQRMMAERNADLPENRRVVYRIGVHLGDVLVEGDDLLGDGVNVAARLEGVAEPGGVCLSRVAYGLVRGKIEADFLDLGETNLKNIARPTRVYAMTARAEAPGSPAAQSPAAPPLSLVVLPFANIGGGPEQDYFVDGVTESLTTDLSRIFGAFVIARNTAFSYKGKPVDRRALGRELGVRYVLAGSVQRSGEAMRVNVQLTEAETGAQLWAERFDKPVADLFTMQDEIVSRIANTLKAEIVSAAARRAARTANPDALHLWLRGFDWIQRGGGNPEPLANARDCFARALTIDPDNVDAMTGLGLVDTISAATYAFDDRPERMTAAETTILKALSLAPQHAMAHYCFGQVLSLTRRPERAIAEFNEALALDRNLALAHAQIGSVKIALGRAEETEAHVAEAMRLSPRDSGVSVFYSFLGYAKLMLGKDEEALAWLRKSVEANRTSPLAIFTYAAALALVGRIEEARAQVQAGLAIAPEFTVRGYRLGGVSDNPTYLQQRERVIDGLRKAGVPDG
jgi:TolB-like protein/Flp pilus assembly protein TadD